MQVIPCTEINQGLVDRLDSLFISSGETGRYDPIEDGDHTMVFRGNDEGVYVYRYDVVSTALGNAPRVVTPLWASTGVPFTGPGRWILKAFYSFKTVDYTLQAFGLDTVVDTSAPDSAILVIPGLANENIVKLTFALGTPGSGDVVVNLYQKKPDETEVAILSSSVILNGTHPTVEVDSGFADPLLVENGKLYAKVSSTTGTAAKGLLVGIQIDADLNYIDVPATILEGYFPLKAGTSYVNGALHETTDLVISDKIFKAPSGEFDTGSIRMDDSVTISSNSVGLEVVDETRSKNRIVLHSTLTPVGNTLPVDPGLSAKVDTPIFADGDEFFSNFDFTFTIPSVGGREGIRITDFGVIANTTGTGAFTIKYGSSTGKTLVTQTSVTFGPGDVDVMSYHRLENAIWLYNGETIYVEYSGVSLKGLTVGSEFHPHLNVQERSFETKEMARIEYVDAQDIAERNIPVKYYETASGTLISPSDRFIVIRFQGTSSATQTLPDLSDIVEGTQIFIENLKTDKSTVTLFPGAAGQQIAGASSYEVLVHDWIKLIAAPKEDPKNWYLSTHYDYAASGSFTGLVAKNVNPINILNTAAVTYDFSTVTYNNGIYYNATTDEFTFDAGGTYVINLQGSHTSVANKHIESWLESCPESGSTWTAVASSGVLSRFSSDANTENILTTTFTLADEVKLRLRGKSLTSASAVLSAQSLDVGISTPSLDLTLYKVD